VTTELFTNTGGISRDAADRAVQWLVDNAEEIARRKAMMVYHEDRLRVVKSTAMALSDEKSIAAKEAEAYRSGVYKTAVDERRNAVFNYERLMNSKMACIATKELFQTFEASLRHIV
jgi:hypothetical protein